MSYECTCGETFPTLTQKRIHQKDECPDREETDVSDLDVEDAVRQFTDELIRCDNCEARAEEIEAWSTSETEDGVEATVEFTCWECGYHNENRGWLE